MVRGGEGGGGGFWGGGRSTGMAGTKNRPSAARPHLARGKARGTADRCTLLVIMSQILLIFRIPRVPKKRIISLLIWFDLCGSDPDLRLESVCPACHHPSKRRKTPPRGPQTLDSLLLHTIPMVSYKLVTLTMLWENVRWGKSVPKNINFKTKRPTHLKTKPNFSHSKLKIMFTIYNLRFIMLIFFQDLTPPERYEKNKSGSASGGPYRGGGVVRYIMQRS